jgi:hypothetical protein
MYYTAVRVKVLYLQLTAWKLHVEKPATSRLSVRFESCRGHQVHLVLIHVDIPAHRQMPLAVRHLAGSVQGASQEIVGPKAEAKSEGIEVGDVAEAFDCVITCRNRYIEEGRHQFERGHVPGCRRDCGVKCSHRAIESIEVKVVVLGADRRSVPGRAGYEDCLGIGAEETPLSSHVGIEAPDLGTGRIDNVELLISLDLHFPRREPIYARGLYRGSGDET